VKTKFRWPYATGALVSLCFCCLSMGIPAWAAEQPGRLKTLTISIWLEYDRPGALYIYRGELPADVPLPATLSFRLPARASGPPAAAVIDAEGKYHYEQPQVTRNADGVVASFEAAYPRFQVEYYDNTLQAEGAGRRLEFAYRAEYAIGQLVFEVKEPYGATDFDLNPLDDACSQAEDGLTVHRRDVGAVAAGQEVHWSVSYTKIDPRLAVEVLSLPTAAPVAYDASPRVSARHTPRSWLMWGLWVTLALIGVGMVGMVVRASTRPHRPPEARAAVAPKPTRRRRAPAAGASPPKVRQAKYCHQCGASLSQKDAFCRQCGMARRGAEAQGK